MVSKLSKPDWQRLKLLRRIAQGSRVSTASYDGALYQFVVDSCVIVDATLSLAPDYTLLRASLTADGVAEMDRLEAMVSKAHLPKPSTHSPAPASDAAQVSDLAIGIRARNALRCNGLTTVGEVRTFYAEHGPKGFLALCNVGKVALKEIEGAVGLP